MTADTPERDYEVGYGKTPTHTRFKRGQSGNPSGRKKRAKTAQEILDRELNKVVTLKENGRTVKMTRKEFLIKKAVHKACKDDPRDLTKVMKEFGLKIDGPSLEAESGLDSPEDIETSEDFLKRVRGES